MVATQGLEHLIGANPDRGSLMENIPLVEKRILLHRWWECILVQPLCKTWKFLKKNLKIELACDPAVPLLGVYLENIKTLIQKDMYPRVYSSTVYNRQDMETTQVPINIR